MTVELGFPIDSLGDFATIISLTNYNNGKGKCKAIPLYAWTNPECSRN
jgi:hypothetical protein